MIYIYAQKRYLPNLGPCKVLRKGLCIMQLSIYRTIEGIVLRIWPNSDTGLLAIFRSHASQTYKFPQQFSPGTDRVPSAIFFKLSSLLKIADLHDT